MGSYYCCFQWLTYLLILAFAERREYTKKKRILIFSLAHNHNSLCLWSYRPAICMKSGWSPLHIVFFYPLDVLPRSFSSGSLPATAIRLSIEGYTYMTVVFNGNCSGIDVRFFPLQFTFTPECLRYQVSTENSGCQGFPGSEVHSHRSGQAVEKFKQQEKVINVRLK